MQQLIKSCLIQFLHEFSIFNRLSHSTRYGWHAFPLATTEKKLAKFIKCEGEDGENQQEIARDQGIDGN